jgi:hypothetical protein
MSKEEKWPLMWKSGIVKKYQLMFLRDSRFVPFWTTRRLKRKGDSDGLAYCVGVFHWYVAFIIWDWIRKPNDQAIEWVRREYAASRGTDEYGKTK